MTNNEANILIDRTLFDAGFPKTHFQFKHSLMEHPLFKIERLLTLAQNLPTAFIEYNSGGADISQDPMTTPYTNLTLEETIQNIDTYESWVVLKYVEYDAEYRDLLFQTLHDIVPVEQLHNLDAHQLEAYIFISSPRSVTPFHFDDEHNFLLQVCGTKQFHGWSNSSLGKASSIDLERYYLGGHRNLPIKKHAEIADNIFELNAGDGLHVPVHSPHWVQNGDDVSISFSVTFRSTSLTREALIHKFNGRLRKLGLSPRPYGKSKFIDNTKYQLARLLRKLSS